jgi:hypothetical protein
MNLYYKIWADAIIKLRSQPKNFGIWKFYSMAFMSMGMALNLVFILFILAEIKITDKIFIIPINIFPGTKIDAFISFFISYLLPFLAINYFFIFYKDKYKNFLPRYRVSLRLTTPC